MLASDLDGTFLNSKGEVSSQNRNAVRRAVENNLEVIFVTGRPARWLRGVADMADHYNIVIGANGAFVADLERMEVIQSNSINSESLGIVVERILSKYPDAGFAIERAFVGMPIPNSFSPNYSEMFAKNLSDYEYAVSPGFATVWKNVDHVPVAPVSELIAKSDIAKVLVKPGSAEGWTSDSWLAEISSIVEQDLQTTHASEHIVLAELSAVGVTKATALSQVAQARGLINLEIVAVGDMPNDIPMLEWAGESWAVENAHDEVLAVTKNRLPHSDEHAVAQLIDDLLSR